MASGGSRKTTGSVNGTGATLDVKTVGYRPKTVKLYNQDGLATAYWTDSMPDDSMLKEVTAGTKTFPTTNGVTPLADGFRLGADADMNVADELIHWECTD